MTPVLTHSADRSNSHSVSDSDWIVAVNCQSFVQRAGVEQIVASQAVGKSESDSWLHSQLAELQSAIASCISHGKAHRWPLRRVVVALRAILDGDDQWRLRAAGVLLGGEW